MLLIHGARAVLLSSKTMKSPDTLRRWVLRVEARRGHNKAATALANKLARVVWAVWRSGESYRGTGESQTHLTDKPRRRLPPRSNVMAKRH